ncbi:MAG: hypothetical protein AAGE84_15160 [Cyanobacteria bacterium P01_G01_bin.39]
MLATWSVILIHFTLPLFIFLGQPMPLLNSQPVIGVFGSEYKDYYNNCVEKSEQQVTEITQLTAALREAETKLNDVDIYRESLEQRAEILNSREENLKNRQIAIDAREQLLEQRNFDFTSKLEAISRNGGKAEEILTNNEMLKSRVDYLERKLDEERISSKQDLEKEREFFRKSLEQEGKAKEKLLDRVNGANQVLLILETITVIVGLLFIGSVGFLYINWFSRKMDSSPRLAVKEVKQDNEALPPV